MAQQSTCSQSSDLNEIHILTHFISQISIKFNEYAIFKNGLISCTRSKSCWSRLEIPLLDQITGTGDQSVKVPCKAILCFLKSSIKPDQTIVQQTVDNLVIKQQTLEFEKVINLYIEEIPDLIPLYNLDTSNYFKASPKILLDILVLFPESLDYLTLNCAQDSFSVQTWREIGEHRTMDTLVSIDIQDFIEYSVIDPCSLTANFKDLKRVLAFVNGCTDVEMLILFDGPGSPIIVQCFITDQAKAEFVVATFVDSGWTSILETGDRKVNLNVQEQFLKQEDGYLIMQDDEEEVYESDPEPSAVSTDSLFKRLKEI